MNIKLDNLLDPKKKTVVELNKIIAVPEDYIECSLCGLYKDPLSYQNEGETKQSRTNCKECYHAPLLSHVDIRAHKDSLNKEHFELKRKLEKKDALRWNSVPVEELISALNKLPQGARVTITQEGYYACGDFAELLFNNPKLIDDNTYSIGNSSQDP